MRSLYMLDSLEPIYGRGSYQHRWAQTRPPGEILRPQGLKASRFGVIEAPSEFWNFSRVAICPNAAKCVPLEVTITARFISMVTRRVSLSSKSFFVLHA